MTATRGNGLRRLLQSGIGARLVLEPLVVLSYRTHLRTGRTSAIGYSAMRKLFGSPRSQRLDELAEHSALANGPLLLGDAPGVISDPPHTVTSALRQDGIAVLESRLPEDLCAALVEFGLAASCDLTEASAGERLPARFDPARPRAVRYDVPEAQLLNCEVVQSLLADRSILRIAQTYLGGAPVQDLVAMWWTSASPTSSQAAAQQFHFDLDRLRFLKLFVYLTDVGPDNGPHLFVRGSHHSLPMPLREDRRFSDAEVLSHFKERDIVSVTGGRGTMFLADTRGLHKGLNVANGHRLVFQLEYATSLFGAAVPEVVVRQPSAALVAAAAAFPATYRRFDLNT
jgi:Phytanoyl-CoA dioxygenase (PhyH)